MILTHSGNLDSGFLVFSTRDRGYGNKDYTCDISGLDVALPRRWQYDERMTGALDARVTECAELLGCSEDDARDALGDLVEIIDDSADPADGYKLNPVQRVTCEIARSFGYAVVEFGDERGIRYAIDAANPDVVIKDQNGRRVNAEKLASRQTKQESNTQNPNGEPSPAP